MNFREALDRVVAGFEGAEFYEGYLDEIKKLLSGTPEGTEIPARVVQEITKWVENQLRAMTEGFSGNRLEPKVASGVALIGAMQSCGLLRRDFNEADPIHYLLRWYVSQRNVATHEYPTYRWPNFLTLFWISNYVLTETLRRRSNPRAVLMDLRIEPSLVNPGQLVRIAASFTTPQGVPFIDGKFDIRVRWANSQVRTVALSFNTDAAQWQADLATSAAVPGEFDVDGEATGLLGDFIPLKPKKGKILP
jgi:hypothetical protein